MNIHTLRERKRERLWYMSPEYEYDFGWETCQSIFAVDESKIDWKPLPTQKKNDKYLLQ
jgi:hypothetical protein